MTSRRRHCTRLGETTNWARALKGYAAAAGGAAAALGAGDAGADVLYTDITPDLSTEFITNSADSTLVYFDVNGQTASASTSLLAPFGADFNLGYSDNNQEKPDFNFDGSTSDWAAGQVAKAGSNYDYANMFGPNESIGPNYDPPPVNHTDGQIWALGGWLENNDGGPWHNGGANGVNGVGAGFVGFRLDFDGLGLDYNYGWAQVHYDDNANTTTLLDFAIETDVNTPITTPEITPPPASLVGDFNDDLVVDGADLAQWKSNFGSGPGADADGDGDTDGADFLRWQQNFGDSAAGPASVAAIPEPHSLLLAAMGAGGVTALRRRRRGVQAV